MTGQIKPEDRLSSRKVLTLPHDRLTEERLSEADRIRGVIRSLVMDALAVLDEMLPECQQSPSLIEEYYLLYHYLDYLKRFCERKV